MNLPWYLLFKAPLAKYTVNVIMVYLTSLSCMIISSTCFFVVQPWLLSFKIVFIRYSTCLDACVDVYRLLVCPSILLVLFLCIFLTIGRPNPYFCEFL